MYLKKYLHEYRMTKVKKKLLLERDEYFKKGQIPWTKGYNAYKIEIIKKNIFNNNLLDLFKKNEIPKGYGYRIDERIVEYVWLFSKLPTLKLKILDAGSTFNFKYLVNHPNISNKELTIFTFAPEKESFNEKRISYVYGDLRELPFKKYLFDVIISQSTIEHIDMDNSMYGYELKYSSDNKKKSYEYIIAIKEMIRVLKNNGDLFLTFPYGKFENHGFFQQFDTEMVEKIEKLFDGIGKYELTFFKYIKEGWILSKRKECNDEESYNPHTGRGMKDDFAAHSRAICCVHFKKNK